MDNFLEYLHASLSLSLCIFIGTKTFRTDIARKINTCLCIPFTFFVKSRLFKDNKNYVYVVNSVSWEPLYLIYQVLFQSSDTNLSYHRCMKIVFLTEVVLCVIVYMQILFFAILFHYLRRSFKIWLSWIEYLEAVTEIGWKCCTACLPFLRFSWFYGTSSRKWNW
jgi:hypothetical protein